MRCLLAIMWVSGLLASAAPVTADPSPPIFPATPAPKPTPESHYREGFDGQKKGDFRKAARGYEAAIKLRESYPEAWNGLGFALRQQGKFADAIKAYERALALRPDYSEALEYLGEAYVRMGRLDDARAVLTRLQPLDAEEAWKLQAAIDAKKP